MPGRHSVISAGTTLQGDLSSDTDIRIDGHITGHIHCRAKVVLGASAIIDGDLEAANADIMGTVNGNVTTSELLCLKSGCIINGDISVGRLDIEANSVFNGKCTMTLPAKALPASPTAPEPPQKQDPPPPQASVKEPITEKKEAKKPVLVIGEEEVGAVQPTLL
ncbi:MAG: polymer-forming cytoskeletal protein [Flavipsychrobacter sp.]|nr:polymer-forming cytoskeletal protein [Flavipsychrobacter sp.]